MSSKCDPSVVEFILRNNIRNVCRIYDKEYQRKTWIRGDRSAFESDIKHYFDTAEYIFKDYKKFGISDIQFNVLRNFHDKLEKFIAQNDRSQLFIDSPEWLSITFMAKDVLEVFDCYTKYLNRDRPIKWLCEELDEISDKEYQRRVWIRGEGPECDDFAEAVCRYSSVCVWVLKEYMELGISEDQLAIYLEFHEAFTKFWQNNDYPQLFIDTPGWTKITLMAKKVLEAFNDWTVINK